MYMKEKNILITCFINTNGMGELTDFMPIKEVGTATHQHHIMRSIHVIRGSMPIEMTCRPAFNYARDTHTIELAEGGAIFKSDTLNLGFASSIPVEPDGQGGVRATFTLHEGQREYFVLETSAENECVPPHLHPRRFKEDFENTMHYWQNWLSQCQYQGRWREMVQRSALVLKLLTYKPTGAIVAAPTTSLPETIGGDRNWNYRY